MTVDVIIPVYRPDEKLNRLLEALETQTVKPGRIIIIHTGEVLPGEPDCRADRIYTREGVRGNALENEPEGRPLRILGIIPEEWFDHGSTRNLGALLSSADVYVFMTQDAVPADEYLLENLIRALDGELPGGERLDGELPGGESLGGEQPDGVQMDEAVPEKERENASGKVPIAAAYARQIPYEDCRTIERYVREFNYPENSELRTWADLPARGIKTYCISNVCAAYRSREFDCLGKFKERIIFNEDMVFGAEVINHDLGIVYAAEAKVYHSHNLGLMDQFHRNFDNAVSQAEHPEVFLGISSEREGLKLVKYCLTRMYKDGKLYLAPYFVLNCACRYAGFFLGKHYRKLPKRLVKACSLNKRYWDKKER